MSPGFARTAVASIGGLVAVASCAGSEPPTAAPPKPPFVGSAVATPPGAPGPSAAASTDPAQRPAERRRRVLARGARYNNPTSMVVDERAVYATTGGANVLEIPKDGSGASGPVFTKATVASSLAIDAEHLYVASGATALVEGAGAVIRVDKRTKQPAVIARHRMPTALSIDAANVWFGDQIEPGAWRVPKTGGEPVAIAGIRGLVSGIDQDESRVYFSATQYGPSQRGALFVAPKAGGAAKLLLDGLTDAMGVAVYDGDVWYNDNGTVKVLPAGGGAPRTVSDKGSTIAFARRPNALFWCSVGLGDANGHVAAVERAQAGAMAVSIERGPVGVAADETAVFFADAFTGEVVSVDF